VKKKFIKNINSQTIVIVNKMLVDIEKLDPSIPYNKYYLNYFK